MKYPKYLGLRQFRKFAQDVFVYAFFRSNLKLWAELMPVLRHSSSTGCTFYELYLLYQHVVRERPRNILELGAGVSTIVLGLAALKVRGKGYLCRVTSMEESSSYYQELVTLIPPSVAGCIDLILSPTEDQSLNGWIARTYTDKPRNIYEMVFIDGPQVPKLPYFDGDIIEVREWNPGKFTAFVDGRKGTLETIVRLWPSARMSYYPQQRFARFDFPCNDVSHENL